MTITKTKINVGPHPVNYIAVEPVEGYPNHVSAVAHSIPDAIAACFIKKEAHDSVRQRRAELAISLECMGQAA